jgi:hypothetical protein
MLDRTMTRAGSLAQEGDTFLDRIGASHAAVVAAAYDTAVSILSLDDRFFVPSRAARIDMIRAMLTHACEHGFDQDRLTLAALAAARSGMAD